LRNGLLEGRLSFKPSVSGDLMHDTAAASRFTKHRDTILVASEEMDILLDPF
jgi:hypothetical protein